MKALREWKRLGRVTDDSTQGPLLRQRQEAWAGRGGLPCRWCWLGFDTETGVTVNNYWVVFFFFLNNKLICKTQTIPQRQVRLKNTHCPGTTGYLGGFRSGHCLCPYTPASHRGIPNRLCNLGINMYTNIISYLIHIIVEFIPLLGNMLCNHI